ncbi:putative nucleic acid-binding protein [Neorhizobium huautlense]|uniref:Nucleic acid-binding protein n=1 Tax=Neorhizobium huautlense TaxID=67774 RepID=A0ABT9PW95_9HYPH|nr:PIN domain-containing protein [Neorhizobium huautlense]MDP9838144.1 putative nucleic acid-binding protein [Neorhizobium huautlense]
MILVDTVIWADHFGKPDARLMGLLEEDEVHIHPHIIGELALGNLRQHDIVIGYLQRLPQSVVASDKEVLATIRLHRLSGSGIGYSDAHIMASVLQSPGMLLWTRDRRLNAVVHRFGRGWTSD